jgi:hypothetical protein
MSNALGVYKREPGALKKNGQPEGWPLKHSEPCGGGAIVPGPSLPRHCSRGKSGTAQRQWIAGLPYLTISNFSHGHLHTGQRSCSSSVSEV